MTSSNIWELNNTFLCITRVKDVSRQILKYFELNLMKIKVIKVLEFCRSSANGELIALNVYIIKEERSKINILSIYLVKVKVKVLVTQLCPSLWDPIRLLCLWNSPGKNTIVDSHSFSRGSSQPKD